MKKLALALQSWGPAGALVLAALDSAGIPLPGGVVALIVAIAATNPTAGWLTAALAVAGLAVVTVIAALAGAMAAVMPARRAARLDVLQALVTS